MITAAGLILLIVVVVIIVVAVKKGKDDDDSSSHTNEFKAEKYEKAAVASDAALCSKVGAAILKKKGSAIDSAIATTFCLGVVNLHSCGIGGGGFMVFYKRATKKFIVYDFREVAPAAAAEDMYVKNPSSSRYGKFINVLYFYSREKYKQLTNIKVASPF